MWGDDWTDAGACGGGRLGGATHDRRRPTRRAQQGACAGGVDGEGGDGRARCLRSDAASGEAKSDERPKRRCGVTTGRTLEPAEAVGQAVQHMAARLKVEAERKQRALAGCWSGGGEA
jgi:hypothetical protein